MLMANSIGLCSSVFSVGRLPLFRWLYIHSFYFRVSCFLVRNSHRACLLRTHPTQSSRATLSHSDPTHEDV